MTIRFARTSLARWSVVAIAALVAGGCGSAASSDHAATRSAPPKLSLTKTSVATGAADAREPGAPAMRPTTYVLDAKLADLGSTARVYRWTAHSVDVGEVDQIARALGISGAATATADGFQATDSDATLTVTVSNSTAQVSYYPGGAEAGGGSSGSSPGSIGTGIAQAGGSGVAPDGSTTGIPPAPTTVVTEPATTVPPPRFAPVDVPSANHAEAIARHLLDNAGVLAGQQWESEVTDSGGIAISCRVGELCTGVPGEVTARNVAFHLVIGGVRVTGVDWTVTVGEHSKIESVYGEWASATPLGTYGLRSTDDAFTALKNGDGNTGGIEPLQRGVPVNAQDTPAVGPETSAASSGAPVTIEPGTVHPVPAPGDTGTIPTIPEPKIDPLVVHVTGVSLGLASWNAVDGNQNAVDLVPVYVFHTSTTDPAGGDPSTSDLEQLALDPGAIQFAAPIPVPVPEPAPAPEPMPPVSVHSSAPATSAVPVPPAPGYSKPASPS